jgi:hypothetical protein
MRYRKTKKSREKMTDEITKPEPVDYTKKDELPQGPPKITEPQAYRIKKMLAEQGISDADMTLMVEKISGSEHKTHYTELGKWQASEMIERLLGKDKKPTGGVETPTKQEKAYNPPPKEAKVCEPTQETAIVSAETRHSELDFRPDFGVIPTGTRLAAAVAPLIEENKLYTSIGGKKHVEIEGWELFGAMLGYTAQTTILSQLPEGGYVAEASILDRAGRIVSRGQASCSQTEKKWKGKDDYALRSMAQTRALGKAYRLHLGWAIRLKGYSATPAEEMEE